jgi:maltooligosyltrehalose trehalohydrolase
MSERHRRRLPIGAEVTDASGVSFRVWAPRARDLKVVLSDGGTTPLVADSLGYFSGIVPSAHAGSRYRFRLDGDREYPDPASRFQPEGPHGPSEVVDPAQYRWSDTGWRGVSLRGQVIYELHIGTFTRQGTWASAEEELPALAELGVTVIEVMPVNEFAGCRGWGYDGVDLFAPTRVYGTPDEMRHFVDRAHQLGIGVILDVVYNHLGPDGNYLAAFSKSYFTDRHTTDWGEAINYDGPDSGPVREFFISNAAYWIEEYHLDGLRFDATQNIYDSSSDHILTAIVRETRSVAKDRRLILVAENETQDVRLIQSPEKGGYGLDGVWNDDFHHSARVALTRHSEAYYSDFNGAPSELIATCKHGYLYQGQRSTHQNKRRGTRSFGLPAERFITFLENHDQVSNAGYGERLRFLTSPGRLRAMTAFQLLAPGTPMLFQGQEFASSSSFVFFADHGPVLAKLVSQGRKQFLAQFASLRSPEAQARIPEPADEQTFASCKLDLSERERNADWYALHRDLLKLRREDPVFRLQGSGGIDGAILSNDAFVLRHFGEADTDRVLIINLGSDLHLSRVPEPLLAPPTDRHWQLLWSTQSPRYGAGGTPPVDTDDGIHVPGESALVLC